MRECKCPPAWLVASPKCADRLVRCAHFDGRGLYMWRHFDMPDIILVSSNDDAPRYALMFNDAAAALRAFEEQERVLMGREA